MMGAYPDGDIARASLAQMNEISRRAEVAVATDGVHLRILGDAGIARRDVHLVHLRVTSQGTHECVLPRTGADDQDDHKRGA